jgi:uncharacterized lipoprotein YehR (DUF1307 family)
MNKTFFGKQGITLTTANHLCNIAQEKLETLKQKYSNLSFVKESISYNSTTAFSKLPSNIKLDEIDGDIKKMYDANSFCAYMRSAIKEHNNIMLEFDNKVFDYKEMPDLPKKVTFDDILAEKDIKYLSNYYTLEAQAATYGKLIHPDGYIANARLEAMQALEKPVKLDKDKLIITYYEVIHDLKVIEDTYLNLQKLYHSYESKLNCLKAEINNEVNRRNIKNKELFVKKSKEIEEENRISREQFFADIEKEKMEFGKLKIIIPDSLVEFSNNLAN